jgi:MoaA/NifB/PqqE/SkfB family radical SAM enzyme
LQKIGNLFGRELRLLTEASPCTSESCNLGEWAANLAEKELVYKEIEAEEKGSAVRSAVSCGYILEEIRPEGAERQDVVVARSRIVPHRIFYTWDIHYACNYRCSYCNTPKPNDSLKSWDRDRMKVVYPTLGRLISVWYDLYERYGSSEIHITGGEPTIYPNFFKLVNNLSRFHTLEVISNLSFDASQLIDAVSAQRLRLGATFHPEFCNIDDFVNKLKILKNSGFEVWTNYVAHPSQLKEMSDHRKKIIDSQATFNIQPYLGFYQGREYPSGYTPEELQLLKDCYDDQDFVNTKTIEWKTAQKKRDMRARSCRMGQMYAKIYPVGDAYRCCAKGSARLGNIFDGTFELQNEAAICESEHCFCWRCMLVDGEKDWGQHWVIPGDKRIVDENDPIPERHILAEQGT